jgi:myo-inositol-1(or 4)-monophosphatase
MKNEIDLDGALSIAIVAAEHAAQIIEDCHKTKVKVRRKEGRDIVSEVDIKAEGEIIKILKSHYPYHNFASEELGKIEGEQGGLEQYDWIIDPLDGTINFVSGLPLFSTSIALQKRGKTLLGVIYNPITKEKYTSIIGRGSFLNGRKLSVSPISEIGNSVFSFMQTSHYDQSETEEIFERVMRLGMVCRGLRLYVSQALELGFIAEGKLEGTICIKSRGYSAASGVLIVKEAGGKVTDIYGKEFNNKSRSLLVTNSKVHNDLLKMIE